MIVKVIDGGHVTSDSIFFPLCAVYEVKCFHGMFNFEKFVAESNHVE